jgi:hypothetical protein
VLLGARLGADADRLAGGDILMYQGQVYGDVTLAAATP